MLYNLIYTTNHDSKIYGWRDYFRFGTNLVFYPHTLPFNRLHCLLSILFITKIDIVIDSIIYHCISPSIGDSVSYIDEAGNSAFSNNIYYIVQELNSASKPSMNLGNKKSFPPKGGKNKNSKMPSFDKTDKPSVIG
jgi:hypothetical protein